MSKLLLVLLLVSVGYGVYRISALYNRSAAAERAVEAPAAAQNSAPVEESLPGLTPQLESSLATASSGGASAFKNWLTQYSQFVPEPRLASIQLDYAQMLVRSNPAEARRIYASVKARTAAGSALASRVAKLSRTFE